MRIVLFAGSFIPLLALATGSQAASAGAGSDRTPAAKIGEPAPDFTLPDSDGKPVSLKSFAGKAVVLEWFNPECPFVVYAHDKGPLSEMAKRETGEGVVWIAINSGAPGKQGHGVEKNVAAAETWGMRHRLLFDEKGTVGRAYGAKTTPHMFVVDPKGRLVYNGGLDNAPFGEPRGGELDPYTERALKAVRQGQAVPRPETEPYGCSVKYGS